MKQIDCDRAFKDAFGSVPDCFHKTVVLALSEIEKSENVKAKGFPVKRTWGFVIAAVLIFGAAFAAGTRFSLMDFLISSGGETPLADAEKSIQTNLGSAENEFLRYTVAEAVYDGESVRALVEIVPVHPGAHIFQAAWEEDAASDEGGAAMMIPCPQMETSSDSVPMDFQNTLVQGTRTLENGGWLLYLHSSVMIREYTSSDGAIVREADAPAKTLPVRLVSDPDAYWSGEEEPGKTCAVIGFSLDLCETDTCFYDVGDADFPEVKLLGASVTNTPFASYLEIHYSFEEKPLSEVLVPGTVYYATQYGIMLHTEPDCMNMKNAKAYSYEQALALEQKLVCPECAGGSREEALRNVSGGNIDFVPLQEDDLSVIIGSVRTAPKGFVKTCIMDARASFPDTIALALFENGAPMGQEIVLPMIR